MAEPIFGELSGRARLPAGARAAHAPLVVAIHGGTYSSAYFDVPGYSLLDRAAAVGIPILASIPADEDIRRKSASYEIVGRPGGAWGPLFGDLAQKVAESEPLRPKPLSQDGLLGLFKSEAVGRGVVLQPASTEDMCGSTLVERPSLEIVYDTV